ncbi:MAG: hypothetical protein ABI616_01280 [Pseudomonadota bacterium]
MKTQDKGLGKARKSMVKLVKRHDAARSEADAIAKQADESIRAMDSAFLDARFQLKGQLTQMEWDALWAQLDK